MPEIIIREDEVKKNYLKLKESLPDAVIAYALKANYHPAILKTLKKLGAGAEVCSEYEYEIARKAGFKKIIINGFVKQKLQCHLQNVESLHQEVSGLRGARMNIKESSKMGLSEDEILKNRWDAIAFHSSRSSTGEWNDYLNKALRLANKTNAGIIDAGGGINDERIKLLKGITKELIIEPGKQLVENSCELITEVLMIKDNNVIIDTGINFFNKLSMSKYEIEVVGREGNKRNKIYRVSGPIPTDLDSLGTYNLPEVRQGDELRIKNCGAYTLSLASDWTRKKPTSI